MQDYKKVLKLIVERTSKTNLIFIFILTFLVAFFESIQLFFIFSIFSELTGAEQSSQISNSLGLINLTQEQFYISAIIISLLAGSLLIFSIVFTGLVAAKIATRTTVSLFNSLADANYDVAKYSSREEYQQAVAKEGDTLSIGVLNPWFQLNIRIISLVFIFLALAAYDTFATFVSMVSVISAYLAYLFTVSDFINTFNVKKTLLSTERLQLVSSVIFGKRDVFIFKLGPMLKDLIKQKSEEYYRGYAILHIIGLLPRFIFESFLITLICIFVLVTFVYDTSYSLTSFGIIGIASLRILPMFQAIFGNYATIKGHIYCIDFFNKLESAIKTESIFFKKNINDSEIGIINQLDSIKLDNITIKTSNDVQILNNKTLFLESGKKYLIQGPSGSGKSTLIDALIGLIPINSGTIEVDGKIIKSISQINTDIFSVVSQKVNIFEGSIKYNITFQENSIINEERLDNAIKISKMDNYLPNLDEGLETFVSETGSRLSGGQLQRIAIARAIYKESSILILDEATNGLEDDLEKQILDSIEKSYKGIIVYISHNSSYKARVDVLINI